MSRTSPFRGVGQPEDVQAELEAVARRIGAPSLDRVEDLLVAARAARPGRRRFFVRCAIEELHELAVRDAQAGMEEAGR